MNQSNFEAPLRPFGCYRKERLNDVLSRMEQYPLIQQEYKRQTELSKQYALKEAGSSLRQLGSYRIDPFVFKTPRDAAHLLFSIHIRGKGEVRISSVQWSYSERGIPQYLENGDFREDLKGWHVHVTNTAVCQLTEVENGVITPAVPGATPARRSEQHTAARCLHIINSKPEDEVILQYLSPLLVNSDEHYSIQVSLSLIETLNPGVHTKVEFLDNERRTIWPTAVSAPFQRATPTTWSTLHEAAGADASCYLVEGDLEAAERCKRKLLYMLTDMRQGMDLFKRDGWHDDDTYGAVHIGRGLQVTSVIYDIIAAAGVFSSEEEEQLLNDFRYVSNLMMDTGYYSYHLESFPDEKGGKRSNWNADRAVGLGVYALLFPEEELASRYLEHTMTVVDWQLEHVVDHDGAWPENIRYHGAVLHRYFLFFMLLKQLKGTDYFAHTKVKQMYRFLIETATCHDIIQDGAGTPALMSPAVGDANVNDQWFRLLVYAAPFYRDIDPELSEEMMWTWRQGGAQVRDSGASPIPVIPLICAVPDLPARQPDMSSRHYPDIGYVIFRSGVGEHDCGLEQIHDEHFAIYEASPLTYHAHHDEGHFSIWAGGVPLTIDAGTGGYYNGDRHWYLSGSAHNVVQFKNAEGRCQNGPLTSECLETLFSEELDYVISRIPDHNALIYERHFMFIRAGFDVYLVWDRIEGSSPSVWNLHTLSTNIEFSGNSMHAEGLGEMKLTAHIVEPEEPVITLSEGAVGGGYPLSVQQHVQIHGESDHDYVVLLEPRRNTEKSVKIITGSGEKIADGVSLYQIIHSNGQRIYAAINRSEQAVRLNIEELGIFKELGSSKDEPVYRNLNQEEEILNLKPHRIHVFYSPSDLKGLVITS
ncbi:heparinase II/III domain-containing protein [Paenibacillus lemnae]|uniref:Heparinase II/III-like C-terminal domain-containing protein n=1 Tax=Paenibacillus lemnae TaxID=1330551 RepID=A0A848MAQ9_PAELE|nr:heparinase II/III family protein [Paenibacillus lemnae]NMO97043.1 hypothetical protein [Paenibacillus lemnae]